MTVKLLLPRVLLLVPLALVLGCAPASNPQLYNRLVIDTFMPAGFFQNDTFLTLIDAAGNIIVQDDDGNPDQSNHQFCSRIDYQAGLPSGTYYIKVHKPTITGSPSYCIRVLDYNPGSTFPAEAQSLEDEAVPIDDAVDGNGVPTNPVSIDLGQVISRAISPELTDVDWFKLVLP